MKDLVKKTVNLLGLEESGKLAGSIIGAVAGAAIGAVIGLLTGLSPIAFALGGLGFGIIALGYIGQGIGLGLWYKTGKNEYPEKDALQPSHERLHNQEQILAPDNLPASQTDRIRNR